MQQQTLLILKPDVYEKKIIGKVLAEIEVKFNITRLKMLRFSRKDAENFYSIHQDKPFFNDLINYITRDKILAMLIEGEDVIEKVRTFIGATDPTTAEEGTLRNKFGTSLESNVVHASDSLESAKKEIPFFFKLFDPKRQDARYGGGQDRGNRYGGNNDRGNGGQDRGNRYGGNNDRGNGGQDRGNRYGGNNDRGNGERGNGERGNGGQEGNRYGGQESNRYGGNNDRGNRYGGQENNRYGGNNERGNGGQDRGNRYGGQENRYGNRRGNSSSKRK